MGIVRIQSGEVTIPASATTPASPAALPVAVPADDSINFWAVRGAGNASPQLDQARAVLTIDGSGNITHVSAARNTASAATLTIRYQIATFSAGDLSVQRATVTLPGTAPPYDYPISAVTLARAFGMFSQSNGGTTFGDDDMIAITLPATTTARLNTAAPSSGATIAYQVVDCAAAFATVQAFSVSLGVADASGTATISAVTIGASVPIISATSATGTAINIGQKLATAELTSTTQVTVTRANTGQAMTVHGFVITFLDGTTVQHGETTIASGSSTPASAPTFSAVDTARSALLIRGLWNHCGRSAYASDDAPLVASATLAFASTTTATLTRGNTAADAIFPWSVIQFAPTATSDAGQGTLVATGGGADALHVDEAGQGTLAAAGSGADTLRLADSGAGVLGATGSGADTLGAVDAGHGTMAAVGSGADAFGSADAGQGTMGATGGGADVLHLADSGTGILTAVGGGEDVSGAVVMGCPSGAITPCVPIGVLTPRRMRGTITAC